MEIITKSSRETKSFGKRFAASLKKDGKNVVALVGELGSGKTTFVQGLAEGLGVKTRIISPTFIIMRSYKNFYHVDLYRLESNLKQEIENLGLADIWEDKNNIVAVEWAEKISDMLPADSVKAYFEYVGERKRKITVRND